ARRWRARWPRRARGTAAGPRAPAPRPPRGTRARRRAARSRWAGPARSRLRQREQLELHLGDAAAEARQLDAPRAVDEAPRLHHADDRPLPVPEHLPPARRGRVDGRAAGARVGGEELLALAEAADRLRVRAEAPRAHAEPAQVLHRIADVGELPVEDGAQALGTEDDVADAEVAVHEGLGARRGRRSREPAERQLERRVRIERDGAVELLVARELGAGGRGKKASPGARTSRAWMPASAAASWPGSAARAGAYSASRSRRRASVSPGTKSMTKNGVPRTAG